MGTGNSTQGSVTTWKGGMGLVGGGWERRAHVHTCGWFALYGKANTILWSSYSAIKRKRFCQWSFLREGRLPFDSAVELPTGIPQLSLSPHHPSSPWGLPPGASRPNYPPAFGGSLTRGSAVIFAPVLITVPVEGKKNVT